MADNRRKLQQALDGELSSEAYEELITDPTAAQQVKRVRQVDNLLEAAPTDMAPRSLADGIMARIAAKALPEPISRIGGLSLAISLCTVSVIALPLLILAVWGLLSVLGTAAGLNGVAQLLVGAAAVLASGLNALASNAGTLLRTYPFLPMLLVLVPLAIVGLRRYAR